jgi:exodeoxyribonuclease VII small subunit
MSKILNYKAALEELSQIADEMENETVSVDELSQKVKRAALLISYCQDKLKTTEDEVRNVLGQMDGKGKSRKE